MRCRGERSSSCWVFGSEKGVECGAGLDLGRACPARPGSVGMQCVRDPLFPYLAVDGGEVHEPTLARRAVTAKPRTGLSLPILMRMHRLKAWDPPAVARSVAHVDDDRRVGRDERVSHRRLAI